jgi:CTP:phosphocholine cytidylyltransferase-like protein
MNTKRALIITSAGCSTRFSRSVGKDVLKVLYYEDSPEECLLAEQLALAGKEDFDLIIIVGGYAFVDLSRFIHDLYRDDPRIQLVYNDKFSEYGSCYSLACGLNALRDRRLDEIIFMEGDLFFDAASFSSVAAVESDVVTANRTLICADKSVVFYATLDGRLCYVYDTRHASLRIDEAFTTLGNSGQVWKFRDIDLLREIAADLGQGLYNDTNLLIVERYFNARGLNHVAFISFDTWFNCNTIDDYRAIREHKAGNHA